MRHALRTLGLGTALLLPALASAGGYSRIYLVPAVKQCPGPATCPRELESLYTFESIVLHSPSSRYLAAGKPSLLLDIRGVRDASGALFTGNLILHVLSGRVSLPSLGTFPDNSSLTQTAPLAIPLKNGANKKFSYAPGVPIPSGIITNGGGIEVADPDGKRLAVTGSQSKP